MTILVTGDAGFVGSHLADYLINKGHKVVGVDNLSGGFYRNVNEKTEWHVLDLEDPKLEDVFKVFKPELVYHVAADATEGRSQFTPVSATQNNIMASVNVFKNAIKYGAKRIVFTSSMSVYGKQDPPFDESRPRKPVDIYGINKASSEQILEILAGVHGVEYTIIRPHNVYGPRQNIRDAYRNVVGIFINRVMSGKPPIVYGDGEQRRAFTFIDDLVPYLAEAGFSAETSGEIINIGPTEHYSINQLAQEILEAFGSDLKPTYVKDRPLEVKEAWCTNTNAEVLLGYKTKTSFKEGIGKMVEWAKELGPQKTVYLEELELVNKNTPITWKNKLI